jgi:hypothetical protein
MVSRAGAGDIEQMTFGFVDFLKVGVVTAAEVVHIREMKLVLMKSAPE